MAGLEFRKRRQKEDPLVRSWSELQTWLESYGRTAGIVVAVVVIAGGAFYFWNRARETREADASVQLAQARGTYWRGDYATVLQQTRDIETQFAGTRSAAEATRVRGDALYWQGDFKGAISAYEEYIEKINLNNAAFSQVQENLAQALENDGQFERAAQIYEEIAAGEGPRDILAARWVHAGRAWGLAGNRERAVAAYQMVIKNYADTPGFRNAQMRLGELGVVDS